MKTNIPKREEAARQLPTQVAEMESAYSGSVKVVTVIGGDFNTDPTDGQAVMRAATQRVKSLAIGTMRAV